MEFDGSRSNPNPPLTLTIFKDFLSAFFCSQDVFLTLSSEEPSFPPNSLEFPISAYNKPTRIKVQQIEIHNPDEKGAKGDQSLCNERRVRMRGKYDWVVILISPRSTGGLGISVLTGA